MKNSQVFTQIDYRFKILYALGIISVVAGHCGSGGINFFYNWFSPYAFHLGLFAFCSGYFFKEESERNPIKYIVKKAKTLLVPLYLWNFAYGCIVTLLSFKGFTIGKKMSLYTLFLEPITTGHQFVYNLGGWFVIPLFMILTFNVLFRKFLSFLHGTSKEIIFVLFYIVAGIVGVQLAILGYHTGWYLVLVRMLYFLPFFGVGFFYKKILEKYDTLNNVIYFSLLFIIDLVIICIYKGTPSYSQAWCNNFNDGPILPFIVGFLAIFFWLRIAKILEPAIGKSKFVNLIADNTYSIMIHQFMGFMILKTIFAVCYKLTPFCSDFDIQKYKTDIGYLFLPNWQDQQKILYLISGILFPILIQLAINKVKQIKTK